MEVNEKYTPIIGLEIHIEPNTKSKMFCQCPADYFGKEPNTHTCPVCLGMPGGLPVANKEAIRRTILLGQALNCTINNRFKFDRKHYFYPDLAKGYQISQYDEPIAEHGELEVRTPSGLKSFRITRVHLEEDTGKLSHRGDSSYIDYNRGGVPLVEIVTEPDFHNGEDVKAFLEELQVIVRYIEIANADMEKGDMRLEPNISVQLTSKMPDLPDYKVEVKNINSFKFAKKAIEFEVARHIEILESGDIPVQETRGYDSKNSITISQRSKENAADYRYMPDPDIPPFQYTDEQLEEISSTMPELSVPKYKRFISDYSLKDDDAFFLTRDRKYSEFFETVLNRVSEEDESSEVDGTPQLVANYLINKKVSLDVNVDRLVTDILKSLKPIETDEGALMEAVSNAISNNEKAVNDYKSGSNPNSIMFLVGQVMKEMKGQADAAAVRAALEESLK